MKGSFAYHLLLHFIVLLFGFTGILGALISLPSPQLVWYRMLIATLGILFFALIYRERLYLDRSTQGKLLGIGFVIAGHWISFFQAIDVSNVSVTLACISSASFFTALVEPALFGRKIKPYELLLGFMVIAGLFMIFTFETQYLAGILFALLAAFLAAVFTVLNGRMVQSFSPTTISLHEMAGGFLTISLYLLIQGKLTPAIFYGITPNEWGFLLILGLACTAFAFVGSVFVMRALSPFTVSLTINMEPVYGIILALAIFGEEERMSPGFYAGALLILAALFLNTYIKRKKQRNDLLPSQ